MVSLVNHQYIPQAASLEKPQHTIDTLKLLENHSFVTRVRRYRHLGKNEQDKLKKKIEEAERVQASAKERRLEDEKEQQGNKKRLKALLDPELKERILSGSSVTSSGQDLLLSSVKPEVERLTQAPRFVQKEEKLNLPSWQNSVGRTYGTQTEAAVIDVSKGMHAYSNPLAEISFSRSSLREEAGRSIFRSSLPSDVRNIGEMSLFNSN